MECDRYHAPFAFRYIDASNPAGLSCGLLGFPIITEHLPPLHGFWICRRQIQRPCNISNGAVSK